MTRLKVIIAASIVTFGLCLAVCDASAATFVPTASGDVPWIRQHPDHGGVYNSDTQQGHSVTAAGGISFAGTGFTATVYGVGNGRNVMCYLYAYGLTTFKESISEQIFFSGNTSFTMTLSLPAAALGPNPTGLYSFGTTCAMSPVNDLGVPIEIFAVTSSNFANNEIQGAGWVPMSSADVPGISHSEIFAVRNTDSNPRFVSAAIPVKQLAAGNHSITFYGLRSDSGPVTFLCQMNLVNVTTREAFSKTVTLPAIPNMILGANAIIFVPTAGLYDVGLLCKLPLGARLFGARNFH